MSGPSSTAFMTFTPSPSGFIGCMECRLRSQAVPSAGSGTTTISRCATRSGFFRKRQRQSSKTGTYEGKSMELAILLEKKFTKSTRRFKLAEQERTKTAEIALELASVESRAAAELSQLRAIADKKLPAKLRSYMDRWAAAETIQGFAATGNSRSCAVRFVLDEACRCGGIRMFVRFFARVVCEIKVFCLWRRRSTYRVAVDEIRHLNSTPALPGAASARQ